MEVDKKRDKEKKLVTYMIQYYYEKHRTGNAMVECHNLIDYANQRIDHCPLMETKTFCSACKVHCFQKEKREQIKKIMRYSGPRMLWHHPWLAIQHVMITRKEWKKQ